MRTLKKTLSFVLVLAMALSLFGTAFAQLDKYEDVESIGDAYVEAVDVLTGIGVLEGMDEDTFAPQGYYTREQAAKIIAYIAAGPEAAEKMTASCDVFDDVPATKWSAGYIAYCVRAGIIDGYGDGTFGPADYVTGYQFAKMLLTAVGYGVNGEYEGAKWSVSVAKDAIPNGIFAGDLDAATNEPITREQAALMALNALDGLFLVTWNSVTNTYMTNYWNDNANEPVARPATLGWENFGLHTHDVFDTDLWDDGLGFEGHQWFTCDPESTADTDVAVSEWYMDDAILGHYTDTYGLKYADMFKNYAWDEDVAIFVNGDYATTEDAETFAVKGDVDPWEEYNETGWDFYLVDTAGDGDVDKIVCTVEYLAKVISVKEANTYFEEEATLFVYNELDDGYPITIETAGLAEGQYLLVAPDMVDEEDEDDAEIKWMHMPEQYTGKIEEINTNVTRLVGGYELPNIKVNGVETKFSTFMGNIDINPIYLEGITINRDQGAYEKPFDVDVREIIFGNIYTFTYDCFGNIIGIDLVLPVCEIAPQFAHVDAVSVKKTGVFDDLFGIYGMEVLMQITTMDGTTAVYNYPVTAELQDNGTYKFFINVMVAEGFDFTTGPAAVANKIDTAKIEITYADITGESTMNDLFWNFSEHQLWYYDVDEDGNLTLGYFIGIANGEEAYYAYQLPARETLTVDAKYADVNGTRLSVDNDTVLTIKWDDKEIEQYVGYENFPYGEFTAGVGYTLENDADPYFVEDASVEINYIVDEEGDVMEILVNHIAYKEEFVPAPFYFIPTTYVAVDAETIRVGGVDMDGNPVEYVIDESQFYDADGNLKWPTVMEGVMAIFPIGQVVEAYLNEDNELVLTADEYNEDNELVHDGGIVEPTFVGFVSDISNAGDYMEIETVNGKEFVYFTDGKIYDARAYVTPGINNLEPWTLEEGDVIAVWTEAGETAGGLEINELVVAFAQESGFSF